MGRDEQLTAFHENLIQEKVKELHHHKDKMNLLIKQLTQDYNLDIFVEVLEIKADNQPPRITGIELSVKQEIYP